ncbi:MAG TPA: thiamine pyrophosphate-dependent enzyme [Fimbriiglobus sp.]|jgi:thiamine pyrophosphate-dependent acetolactate synthase large subunit-like protein
MMTLPEALAPIAANRWDHVVVTTMSAVGPWPALSDSPLDFAYIPSSMGQAVPLGLGLALAKPGRGVVVVSGDGSLLMNLGCLVTLAQHDVPVHVVLIDNGLYEVTGGQAVAGAGKTDYAGLAKASGISRVYSVDTAPEWNDTAGIALSGIGPVFIWLKIQGEFGKETPSAPRPMAEQIARLQKALTS